MAAVAIDAGVLIALADSDDAYHDTAFEIVRGIDQGDFPTGHVTNYTVLEALNWIHSRKRQTVAIETYERLKRSAGFDIQHAAQKDFHRAMDRFETSDGLSFGDAAIVAYMDRTGIEHLYSFDDDFDGVDDITRLDTATDLFEP